MITKDELAAMIAALESQPHLSLKEEKYLAIMKELMEYRETEGCCFCDKIHLDKGYETRL